MALKFKGCDKSDLELWAKSRIAEIFFNEVEERRTAALKRLIKQGTEEHAIAVRTLDGVLDLYREAQN